MRDRSLLYLEVLKQKQKSLSSAFILNRKKKGEEREGEGVRGERGGGGKRKRREGGVRVYIMFYCGLPPDLLPC